MKNYVLYGMESAKDRYFVGGCRTTDSNEPNVWNEYAEAMKEHTPSIENVYVMENTEEIYEQYNDLFRRGRNHFEDRLIFHATLESYAIAVRRF